MVDFRVYLRSFSWYVIFGIATALIPILFLPFLTKHLEASDFGLITSFNIIAMVLGNLVRLDLNFSLKRFYGAENHNFGQFVTGALLCSFSIFLVSLLVIVMLSVFGIREVLNIPVGWLYLAAALAFFRSQIMNLHHLWQVRNQSFRYGAWGLISMVVVYGAFSGLIVLGDASWTSRVVSEVFVAAVGLLLAAFFLIRDYDLRARTNASALKKMLSFSLPVLPGSFLSYYFITSDRIFISEMFSAAELGLYSLAFQVSAVLEIGFRAIAPVWESWLFREKGVRSFNVIVIAIVSFLVLFLVGLIAPLFIGIIADFLIDKKFDSVDQFLAPCVFAILSAGFYRLTVPLSMYTKNTKNITYTNFLMLISNIPIMLFFIQYFGVAGAGYAVALTFMIGSGFQLFLFSRNALRMKL